MFPWTGIESSEKKGNDNNGKAYSMVINFDIHCTNYFIFQSISFNESTKKTPSTHKNETWQYKILCSV